jgi:hypothetical protein
MVAAIATALLASSPAPAVADLSEPVGACVVTSAWGGATVDSSTADSADVIEVPRADEVTWSARVNGPAEGTVRPVAGSVSLVLPAPFGTATLGEWSGSTGHVETTGTEELPDLLPAGVVFEMRMVHYENGALFCTATVRLKIAGGPDPIAWGSLGLTLLFAALLATLGFKARCSFAMRLLGAGLGLLGGACAGSTLVLFGVLPLNSIATVLLAAAGVITGSFLCKLRRLGRRKKKDKDDKKSEQPGQLSAAP